MREFLYRVWVRFLPVQVVSMMALVGVIGGVYVTMGLFVFRGMIQPPVIVAIVTAPESSIAPAVTPAPMFPDSPALPVGGLSNVSILSAVFTPEIQYWAPHIQRWSVQYGVDANIIATVMQVESCGYDLAVSSAGASGLFQVMPFHFTAGENHLDIETNARRGINYLKGSLERANGDVGLALAGYNGGWGMIRRAWAAWPNETQRYYRWGSGIYQDAMTNLASAESDTLRSWLQAGGSRLCARAAQRQASL